MTVFKFLCNYIIIEERTLGVSLMIFEYYKTRMNGGHVENVNLFP